jgi:hypothetical protein
MFAKVDYSASNPLRPPDWCYRLAAECVASGRPIPRRDWDAMTLTVADYLRREQRGEDPSRLVADYPELNLALDVFRHEDQELRFAIEAKLLAGFAPTDVAAAAGLTPLIVDVFEKTFFDVRDRLENREFIVGTVIAPPRNPPYDFRDIGWKSIAFNDGPEALAVALGPDRRGRLAEIKRADRYATALAVLVQNRQRAENGQLMNLDLLRHLPKLRACLDQRIEECTRLIKQEASVEMIYQLLRVSPEHQEYVEKHHDYPRRPEWQAKVQELRDAGFWGWQEEDSEIATDAPSENGDADAVEAEAD